MNISGYSIEEQIGRGGMAMVYRATQESLGRPVALKVMNPLFADDAEYSQRFLDEGRLLAAVRHNNIITIHDIGISDGFHFIAMEYVDGGDLAGKIAMGLSQTQATGYLETLAQCLAMAHERQIVHRDIKPANVLFRDDGTLLVTDFGIAKQLNAATGLTATGAMVGTPHYLSPEQAQCQPVDGRADIYSLGVVYFEMLTGKRPYSGDSDVCVALRHITEDVPALPAEYGACGKIIARMMHKDPAQRFPSCRSLLVALDELRDTGDWSGEVADIPIASLGPEEISAAGATPRLAGRWSDTTAGTGEQSRVTVNQQTVATIRLDPTAVHDGNTVVEDAAPLDGGTQSEVTVIADIGHQSNARGDRDDQRPWRKRAAAAGLLLVAMTAVVGGALNLRDGSPNPRISQTGSIAPAEVASPPMAAGDSDAEAESAKAARQKAQADRRAREFLIESLLRDAGLAIADYRLTSPQATSAYTYYQRVLEIEPQHPKAISGIDDIANAYYRLARNAEQDWNYQKAMRFANAGLAIRPGHEPLRVLKGSLLAERGRSERTVKSALKPVKDWFN